MIPVRREQAARVLVEVAALRASILLLERELEEQFAALPEARRESARNLIHYIGLRQRDNRGLQNALSELGLSSLGRSESNVLHALETVLGVLHELAGLPAAESGATRARALDPARSRLLLEDATTALLGAGTRGRHVRIMVTMPTEAAEDEQLIRNLVATGMDVMRINCAHDGPPQWSRMIARLRKASSDLGRDVRVMMDIAGPKARTGLMTPGPQVVRWNPPRDELGRLMRPSRIWLTPDDAPMPPPEQRPADAVLPMPRALLMGMLRGDVLRFRDRRGQRRSLRVRAVRHDAAHPHAWCDGFKSAYVEPGTVVHVLRPRTGIGGAAGARRSSVVHRGTLGELPRITLPIVLRPGDVLVLTADQSPGRRARGEDPARIPFTLPEVLADAQPGHRVMLDDGKAGGVIEHATAREAHVRITRCKPDGFRLWPDKGVNLPDTPMRVPPLSAKDLEDLDFVAAHADLVGFSFVRTPGDVELLGRELAGRAGGRGAGVGVVLKIETKAAFDNLPDLLLAALRHRPGSGEAAWEGVGPGIGVMIARGDLAVEMGYERLAEVQEEMLWLCEAAHVPVVWATQVLETLAKKGLPSRSEITDAAMGERAECVMLNKGPYVVDAVRVLDDILRRMSAHQSKKRAMLRPLSVATRFAED